MSGIEKVNLNVPPVSDDKLVKGLLYVGTGAVVAAFAIELLPAAIIVISVKALAAALAGSALLATTGCEQTIFTQEDQCSNSGEPVSANSSREVVTQEIYSCDEPNQTIQVKVTSQSCAKDGNNLTLEAYDTSDYAGTVQRKDSDDSSCTKADNRLTCYFDFPVVPGSEKTRSFGATAYGKAQNPNAPFPAFPGAANERPSIPIYDGTNSIQVKKTQTTWPGPITLDAVVPEGYNTHDARIGDTVKLVVNFKDQLDALGVSYKWEHSLAGQTELLDNNSGELNYTLQALGHHTFTVSYTDPNALAPSCQPEPYQSQAVNSDFEVREEPSITCTYNSANNTFYPDPNIANISRGSSQQINWNIPDITQYLPTTCLTTAGNFSIIDHDLNNYLFNPTTQMVGNSLLISGSILPNISASPIANLKLNDGNQDLDIKVQLTIALEPITVSYADTFIQVGESVSFSSSYVASAQKYHFVVSQNDNDLWSKDSPTNTINYIPSATGPYKIRVEVTAYNGEQITVGQTSTAFFVNEGAGGSSLADSFRMLTTYSSDGAITHYPFKVKLAPATPAALAMIDASSRVAWQVSLDGRILSTDEFNTICSTSTTAPTELTCTPTEEGQYAVKATVTHPTNPTIETEFIKLDRTVGVCIPPNLAIGGSFDIIGGTNVSFPIEVLPDTYRQLSSTIDVYPDMTCSAQVFRTLPDLSTEVLFSSPIGGFDCRSGTPEISFPVISEAEKMRVYQLQVTVKNNQYGPSELPTSRTVTTPVRVYSPATAAEALNFLVIAADNGKERNPFRPIKLRANKTADHYKWEIIEKNNASYGGTQPTGTGQEIDLEFYKLEAGNNGYTLETTNNVYRVKVTLYNAAGASVGDYDTLLTVYPFPLPPYILNKNNNDAVHEGEGFFLLADLGRNLAEDNNATVGWDIFDTADTSANPTPVFSLAPAAGQKRLNSVEHPALNLPVGIYKVAPTITGRHQNDDQATFTDAYEITEPEYLTIYPASVISPTSGFSCPTVVKSGVNFSCFANRIDEALYNYHWSFDDNDSRAVSSFNDKSFTVAAGQISSRAITLTVSLKNSPTVSSSTTQNITVVPASIAEPAYRLDIPTWETVNNSVNMSITGLANPADWTINWRFGDNNTDSGQAVSHPYSLPGKYRIGVTLTNVTDPNFVINDNWNITIVDIGDQLPKTSVIVGPTPARDYTPGSGNVTWQIYAQNYDGTTDGLSAVCHFGPEGDVSANISDGIITINHQLNNRLTGHFSCDITGNNGQTLVDGAILYPPYYTQP